MRFISFFVFWALIIISPGIRAQTPSLTPNEKICGKWEASEKNLVVQVYMQNEKFVAKIIWFNTDHGAPMDTWTDKNNPDKSLRSRKLLGMSVLRDLTYHPKTNSWENGMIYDAKHGREWNSSAYIDKNGLLKVEGYWHFKFIGRTMTFRRI